MNPINSSADETDRSEQRRWNLDLVNIPESLHEQPERPLLPAWNNESCLWVTFFVIQVIWYVRRVTIVRTQVILWLQFSTQPTQWTKQWWHFSGPKSSQALNKGSQSEGFFEAGDFEWPDKVEAMNDIRFYSHRYLSFEDRWKFSNDGLREEALVTIW